jgi:protoheme IX farnesyltransferase
MIIFTEYFVLCRMPISCFTACAALTGYLLTPDRSGVTLPLLAAGVFLLASGASALNQFQDRDIDALMERTRLRPLPAGTMAPRTALIVATGLIASGLVLLYAINAPVAALGAFAVLWYNGLYSPLKRRAAFAAVPGAITGAIPPVMGWAAGGGSMADPKIVVVVALFFLWQIPHFWLLLISDRSGYEQAGLPSPDRALPRGRFPGIVVLWTAAATVLCLALPLFGLALSPVVQGSLVVLAFWMILTCLRMLGADADAATARSVFRSINVFLGLIMVLLSIDPVLRQG